VISNATVPSQTGSDAVCELQSGCTAIQKRQNQEKMNKGLLIIAVPALVVSVFWLTIGWGWPAAALGMCVEIAILAGALLYSKKRPRAS
jgi:hypothetical protein